MKQLMVAAFAVMFFVGLNAVAFADEKGGTKTETKGDMKKDEKKKDTKK